MKDGIIAIMSIIAMGEVIYPRTPFNPFPYFPTNVAVQVRAAYSIQNIHNTEKIGLQKYFDLYITPELVLVFFVES